jgi:hypothetical protein
MKEEGRRKKEEGRRKKEEGRRNWFLGSAWEPMSRGSASRSSETEPQNTRGRASRSALPGRAW